MRAEFTIPGEPVGKGRPRFTKSGHTYTPERTRNYEEITELCYCRECRNYRFESAVGVQIHAFYEIPKSANKERAELMKGGELLPLKKPDADNVGKIVLDALNGIAWDDDAQVVSLEVQKEYSENPRVEVTICDK